VDLARAANLFGGLAFPIVSSEGVLAVIECFTREREVVTPQLLHLFEGIGRQVGQFLQRMSAEERLAENERRYAAIVRGALDAIITIDENGHVLEFNPAAERLFGYTREETLGKEMAGLIVPPSFREAHRAGLRRHAHSGQSTLLERRVELRGLRHDGSEFPIELTISRITVGGRWSFLGFVRDITERLEHERHREESFARERAAHDTAVAANAVKDEFLAALSHELRTPLNAILGWSTMLTKSVADPSRFAKIAETIRRNAQVQQRLVEDMLDLSIFLSGRVRIDAEHLTIDQPVKAACDTVQPAAQAKRVRLDVSVPASPIVGDLTRLQQVFWNLLTNAIKFTGAGGSVRVRGKASGGAVEVTVSDTGQGIAASFVPFVFERFRQAQDARTHGSLGLGLAIVKEIVEAHGGIVTAESEGVGKGSTFTVRLPLAD
jgi:PAS domain S-box-containing protein